MYKKILKLVIIFILIFNWVFGYPPVYENFWQSQILDFPPEIQEAQAAVAYQNKSEAIDNDGESFITISAPAGFSAGDLFIAIVIKDDDPATILPTGETWILIQEGVGEVGGAQMYFSVSYRIAEAGDISWTWTGDTIERRYGTILRYTGQAASPIHASGKASDDTNAPTAPTVSYTDLETGSIALQCFGEDSEDTPYTTPGALTERYNNVSGGSNQGCGGAGGDKAISGTGSTGTAIFGMGGADEWMAVTVVIEAATVTPTTTIGDGSNPGNSPIAPGAGITDLDSFTLETNTGTDSITAATVTLAAGTATRLSEIRITSDNGVTLYFSAVSNPGSDVVNFSSGTPIPVTTTPTQFKVRITPKGHADMPNPPGAEYAVTGTVTSFTGDNTQSGSDSASATITIDNLSPDEVNATSGSAGNKQVTLNWMTSSSSDFSRSVVLRWAASTPGSEVPAEGTDYAVDQTLTTATVACMRTGDSPTTPVSGVVDGAGIGGCSAVALTNDQDYSYKVFQKDSRGNYDVGVLFADSPFMPSASFTLSFDITGDFTMTFGDLNTSNPRWATTDTGSNSESSAHTLTAETNSTSGYSITVKGDTLKYSSYEITACGDPAVSVATGGSKQFGIRITSAGDNCAGSQVAPYNGAANMYGYNATASVEDEIVSCSSASTTTTYSMYYAANISTLTEAGNYTATLTYICTGNF